VPEGIDMLEAHWMKLIEQADRDQTVFREAARLLKKLPSNKEAAHTMRIAAREAGARGLALRSALDLYEKENSN
jgi:hypothetical protein